MSDNDTAALVESLLHPKFDGFCCTACFEALGGGDVHNEGCRYVSARTLAQRLAEAEGEAKSGWAAARGMDEAFAFEKARAERAEAALREHWDHDEDWCFACHSALTECSAAKVVIGAALAAKRCPTCGAPGFCFDHMKGTPTEEPES